MSVPGWVYKRMAMGEISADEVDQLEKLATSLKSASISRKGLAGAHAAVADKSNNLHKVMKNVPQEDRDDVLRALRQMKKQAAHCASSPKHSAKKKRKFMKKQAEQKQEKAEGMSNKQKAMLGAGAATLGALGLYGGNRYLNKTLSGFKPDISSADMPRMADVNIGDFVVDDLRRTEELERAARNQRLHDFFSEKNASARLKKFTQGLRDRIVGLDKGTDTFFRDNVAPAFSDESLRDAAAAGLIGAGTLGTLGGAKALATAYGKSKDEDIQAMLAGKELTKEQRKKRRRKRAASVAAKGTAAAVGGGIAGMGLKSLKSIIPDIVGESTKRIQQNYSKALQDTDDFRGRLALTNLISEEGSLLDKVLSPLLRGKRKSKGATKTASAQRIGTLGQAGLLVGGAALAPVISGLVGKGIDKMMERSPAQRQRDLQRILEIHPDIGRPEDPRVQLAYQSLVRLNPTYAEDPLIAGPLLKQIVESRMDPTNPMSAPYVDPGMAKNLSEARKAIREGNPRNTMGDNVGASVFGGLQAATMGGLVEPVMDKDDPTKVVRPGGFLR